MMVSDAIAKDHDCVAAFANLERHVTGRVPERGARSDTGYNFIAVVKEGDVVFNAGKAAGGPHSESRAVIADGVHGFRVGPIVPFRLTDHVGGVRKQQIIEIIDKTPDVIGVGVGEYNVGDVIWPKPRRIQRVQ